MITISEDQLNSIINTLNHTAAALVKAVDILGDINIQNPGVVNNEDLSDLISKVKNAQYHYRSINKERS